MPVEVPCPEGERHLLVVFEHKGVLLTRMHPICYLITTRIGIADSLSEEQNKKATDALKVTRQSLDVTPCLCPSSIDCNNIGNNVPQQELFIHSSPQVTHTQHTDDKPSLK